MVRYDTGDTGMMRIDRDEKGRIHGKYVEIYGRRGSLMYNTKGEPLSIHVFMNTLLKFEGVVYQARCIQWGEKEYELLVNADREKLFIRSAKDFLAGYLDFYISSWAPVMNVSPASFSIRKTRNKWGSCHIRSKMLDFSLDLISKPLFCIEMVVVHELNHLIESTHNERFHALMHHWLPDYKERQKILSSAKREFY